MKHLKRFDEELDLKTYRDAASRLDYYNKAKRASTLYDYADEKEHGFFNMSFAQIGPNTTATIENSTFTDPKITAIYFGGYDYPGIGFVTEQLGATAATLIGAGALIGKALAFVFIFMWVRWTLPRFRYDQLMGLGWSGLIPLAMFNIVVTGLGVLLNQQILLGIAGVVVFIAGIVVYDQLFVKKKLA